MKVINHLFRDVLGIYVLVYLDDIFIFSDTYREHKDHLREVFKRLHDNKFYALKGKTMIMPPIIDALGYIITSDGMSATPDKLKQVKE